MHSPPLSNRGYNSWSPESHSVPNYVRSYRSQRNAICVSTCTIPGQPCHRVSPSSAVSRRETRPPRTGSLSNQFHDILTAAKLAEKRTHHANKNAPKGRSAKRQTSALSFHSLRHSATSALKREGVNDATARDIVGHESQAISQHYTHIDTDTKRRAISKLPVLKLP